MLSLGMSKQQCKDKNFGNMKTPIEHLQSRIDEMNAQLERAIMINLNENERDTYFELNRKRDIKRISSEISGYKRAIKILEQDSELTINED